MMNYYDEPVCNINNLTLKPRCPILMEHWDMLFHLTKEPMMNEIYSIPLEYLKTNNKVTNVQ